MWKNKEELRIYLGVGTRGAVWCPDEICALILGPPRSGKTASIIIPNVLMATQSVICISTKTDVLDATLATRARKGPCFLFDPTQSLQHQPQVQHVGWSPLITARRWERAILNAEAMVGASAARTHRESSHWHERAGALLATLFHAAAIDGSTMEDVIEAVNRRDAEHFMEVLARNDANLALDLLIGIRETDAREQSGIWSTASGVLAAYRMRATLDATRLPPIDWGAFVEHPSTLYVASPTDHQQHMAPLIAGVIRDLRSYCYAQTAQQSSRRSFSVLLILDELANIAPLHDLPALVAEGASQGITTLASLQDLSQARSRWGVAGEGFLSLFGAKAIFGGIGDVETLRNLSVLAGDHYVRVTSLAHRRRLGYWSTPSRQTSLVQSPRLAPSSIASPDPGVITVVFGATTMHLRSTPYYLQHTHR